MTASALSVRAGALVPSLVGPRVEQVGWGVARQVARQLRAEPSDPLLDLLLERVPLLAEAPGHAAYAVLEGRRAVALALVRLDVPDAAYLGEVVVAAAAAGTAEALVVRALHDAGAAGARRLRVERSSADLSAFPR